MLYKALYGLPLEKGTWKCGLGMSGRVRTLSVVIILAALLPTPFLSNLGPPSTEGSIPFLVAVKVFHVNLDLNDVKGD